MPEILPPFVDVETIRDQMVSFYDEAPYKETAQSFLEATSASYASLSEVLAKLLGDFDLQLAPVEAQGVDLSERLQWYADAAEGADDDAGVVEFVLDPFLDGEYPEGLDEALSTPNWPDAETVWRLMNQLTAAVTSQVSEDDLPGVLEALRSEYQRAYRLFWSSVAAELATASEKIPEEIAAQGADDLATASAVAERFTDGADAVITDPPPTSGSGALALGVLGIGALLLLASRNRR